MYFRMQLDFAYKLKYILSYNIIYEQHISRVKKYYGGRLNLEFR